MMQFDLPKNDSSIIKVFGVGGGGSNAVNHMYRQGITGVDFYVCNTDQQALDISPVPNKIQLGLSLTGGRGAGSIAEVGKNAAFENEEEIREILTKDTKMVFITAGMGGGTGTGAAPVIARIAKELGILTVAIVTYPFQFEGRKRSNQANDGLEELRESVDTCLIVCNDKLREMYGNLALSEAFAKADDILTTAAKGIAEIITVTGYINVDFEDVRTVMTDSGVAIMGSASASGENRALKAAQDALISPLLNDNNIEGANYILLNITSGSNDIMMDEITEITDYIQDEAGLSAEIIWGTGVDESLGDSISVTLIATGFQANKQVGGIQTEKRKEKVVHNLSHQPAAPTKEEAPKVEAVNPLEPTLKAPVAEQAKLDLEIPPRETKVQEFKEEELPKGWALKRELEPSSSQNQTPSVQAPQTPQASQEPAQPKIVHNLYDEEMVNALEAEEEELEEDIQPTFEQSNPVVEKPFTPRFETPSSFQTPAQPAQEPKRTFADELDAEERMRRSQERISQITNMTKKLKTPSGIADLENEPAYIRRNIRLDNVNHSSQSNISRFTLSSDDDKNPEIRPNNSFLHDNVD